MPQSNLVESDPTHAGEYFTVDMQDVPLTDGERVHVDPQLLPLMEGERVGEWCLPTCPPPPPSFICHGCGATVEAITSEPTGSFSLLQRLFPCCCKRRQYGAIVFTTHRIANIFMEGRSKTQGHKYAFAVDAYFLDGVKSGFSTHIPMNPRQRRKGNKQAPMFVNRQAYLHTKYGYLQVSPSPQHRLNCCGCPIGQTMDDDRRAEVVLRAVTRISATPMLPPPRVPETAELVNEVRRPAALPLYFLPSLKVLSLLPPPSSLLPPPLPSCFLPSIGHCPHATAAWRGPRVGPPQPPP